MRTLSRPMFNMGGPIKQGIMHGIREPHQAGKVVVGIGSKILPHIRRAGQAFKNIFGKSTPAQGELYKTPFKPASWKARPFIERDPTYKMGKWGYETLTGPTAKTWGKKALQAVGTPTGALTAGYIGSQFLPDKKETGSPTGTVYPGAPKKKTKEAAAAFAKSQREDRVNKYLKMMGYDQSKKLAIADALIDASKIVGDRGTLDLKNINQDLINPIIQATSKRLDKPQQIREAVGLMATKAAIEKDLEDPSIKALRLEQLKQLKGGFAKDIGDFILSAKGARVKPEALTRYARAKAKQHGLDFTVVTDEDMAGVGKDASLETIIQTAVKEDGVYMIGDAIIQVTDGVPEQIS